MCFMQRFFGHIHASSAGVGLLSSGKLLGFPMSCRMPAFKLGMSCCGAAPTPAKAAFHGLAAKKLRGACMTCHTQANGLIKPSGEVLRRQRCSFWSHFLKPLNAATSKGWATCVALAGTNASCRPDTAAAFRTLGVKWHGAQSNSKTPWVPALHTLLMTAATSSRICTMQGEEFHADCCASTFRFVCGNAAWPRITAFVNRARLPSK